MSADGGAVLVAALTLLLLSPEQNQCLQRICSLPLSSVKRAVICALIISSLVAPVSPQFIDFNSRVASFRGRFGSDDAPPGHRASAGWHLGPDGQEFCFCCGVSSDGTQSRHRCPHQELVSILDEGNQLRLDLEVKSVNPWPGKQANILNLFLQSSLPKFVESFGFERNLVTFAAVKQFVLDSWQLPDSPGQLMRLTQSLADSPFAAVAKKVNVDWLVKHFLTDDSTHGMPATAADSAGMQVDRSYLPRTDSATSPPAVQESRDADSGPCCIICRSREKNRVTLPCAHFAACSDCLKSRQFCPICSRGILATLVAFIP